MKLSYWRQSMRKLRKRAYYKAMDCKFKAKKQHSFVVTVYIGEQYGSGKYKIGSSMPYDLIHEAVKKSVTSCRKRFGYVK